MCVCVCPSVRAAVIVCMPQYVWVAYGTYVFICAKYFMTIETIRRVLISFYFLLFLLFEAEFYRNANTHAHTLSHKANDFLRLVIVKSLNLFVVHIECCLPACLPVNKVVAMTRDSFVQRSGKKIYSPPQREINIYPYNIFVIVYAPPPLSSYK